MTVDADPGAARPRAAGETAEGLRVRLVGMVVLLLLQYAVGMLLNLFVHIPRHHPGHDSQNFFAGVVAVVPWAIGHGGALAIHTALGLLLTLGALFVFIGALRAGRRAVTWLAGLGLLTVVGAGFNGASFLVYAHDQSSLVMAWLFAIAVVSYVLALVRLGDG